MCSDCEDEEPVCPYCGDACFGTCDDPDACRSCWHPYGIPWEEFGDQLHYPDYPEQPLDRCMREECTCHCHEEMWKDSDLRYEAGVLKSVEEHGERYWRAGIFPFLKLPAEIRDRIYGFTFLQDGRQRKTPYHRGTIHTALLSTCRQICNEARRLPLAINKLCFASPVFAHDFLGFLLEPTQEVLVTGMHIEFHMVDFASPSWHLLLREMAKMSISHLGLTIKGGISGKELTGHTCFTNRFKVLKGLKTLDLNLPSVNIRPKEKKDIQEEMREALVKDYTRPKKLGKSKVKRAASPGVVEDPKKATKKPRNGNTLRKYQTKIIASPTSSRLGFKSLKPERDAAKAAKELLKQVLLDQYVQLKQYATTMDSNANPVKIRLEQAREAAEAIDETNFQKLAHGILLTLDEQYNNITNARKHMPVFPSPSPSPERRYSSESELDLDAESTASSLDSQDLSQRSGSSI